jgi:hypothetical protein
LYRSLTGFFWVGYQPGRSRHSTPRSQTPTDGCLTWKLSKRDSSSHRTVRFSRETIFRERGHPARSERKSSLSPNSGIANGKPHFNKSKSHFAKGVPHIEKPMSHCQKGKRGFAKGRSGFDHIGVRHSKVEPRHRKREVRHRQYRTLTSKKGSPTSPNRTLTSKKGSETSKKGSEGSLFGSGMNSPLTPSPSR